MIINLICGDNIFTSNDKQWNKIRGIISSASQEFILDYKNNMLIYETSNDIENDTAIVTSEDTVESDEYNYYQKMLYEKSVNKETILKNINNILKDIQTSNFCINPIQNNSKDNQVFLKLYKKYLNLLTILGLSGIYSLNNTEYDNINGFYSIGNSYDIAIAIDLVLPFVNNEYFEHLIFEVLMIFNYSLKNNLVISVTNNGTFVTVQRPQLSPLNQVSAFVVLIQTVTPTGNLEFFRADSTNNFFPGGLYGFFDMYFTNGGGMNVNINASAVGFGTNITGAVNIYEIVYDGNRRTSYLTGLQLATGLSVGNFLTTSYSALRLLSGITGYFCEAMYFQRALSNLERQQTEGYLAWKWGIQAQLPASHPFRNAPPS